jgi:hypothetical protein
VKALRNGVLVLLAGATFAACGGNSSSPQPRPKPTPTMALPTPTPTSTSTPAPSATTLSLNGGAALTNMPLITPLPSLPGYTQSISIPLVTTAAGTTVQFTTGLTAPGSIAPLVKSRSALRRFDTTSAYSAILYDSIVPSANITGAGALSFTEGFPSGVLTAGTGYYLGFYDTTQLSPAWQTIAGPVTPSGTSLTFSGTTSPVTLVANKLYGFAIFSSASPSGTPPPAPATSIYYGDDTTLTIATESGTVLKTLPIGSNSFDLDDAGNVYASLNGGSPQLAMYPAGSASPAATYSPSTPAPAFIAASGAGEVAAIYARSEGDILANGPQTADVWDPGKSGPPSRTLTTLAGSNTLFALTHDGTLYLPDQSPTGVPEYDVFPPGATTPSRVITETIVPPAQYPNFAPNYAAVGPDGTLYVTEYTFEQPDPNAGTYIYPGNGGAERFIPAAADANGPGPQGVDVDASGNIYVVNNNSGFAAAGGCQGDSLQDVTVYSPSGALLRTIAGGNSGFPVTVAADGTVFFATFQIQFSGSCAATGADAIFNAAAGAATSTQIATTGSTEIILYDGTHKTSPFLSGGHGAGMSHGGSHAGHLRRTKRL